MHTDKRAAAGRGPRRWLLVVAAAAALLALSGCNATVAFTTDSASTSAGAATATATDTATTDTPTPGLPTETPTPTPTATPADTPTPEPTATPDSTATAVAEATQQWVSAVKQVSDVNSTLADVGTRFNNGSLSLSDGAAKLRGLDSQAASVDRIVQALPSLPGTDGASQVTYRRSVHNWSAAIHTLNVAVADNNLFGAPGLANQLQTIATDLDRQSQGLHLPSGA